MTTAIVESRVRLSAEDRASKQIRKANRSLQQTSDRLNDAGRDSAKMGEAFAESADKSAGQAGKLSTALSSLGDFAGSAEGQFRVAGEAAGAFDDVLTVLPGPAGIAVAAIAGITTVLILQAKATREAGAKIREAFGPDAVDGINRVRDGLDLSAEAIIEAKQAADLAGKSSKQLEAELASVVHRAEAMGTDGSAAVIQFAKSLASGVGPAAKLKQLAKQIRIEFSQLQFAKGAPAHLQASQAEVENNEALLDLRKKQAAQEKVLADFAHGRIGPLKDSAGILGGMFDTHKDIAKARLLQNKATADQRLELQKINDEINRRVLATKALSQTIQGAIVEESAAVRDEAARDVEMVLKQIDEFEKGANKRRSKPKAGPDAAGPDPAAVRLQAEQAAADDLFASYENLQAVKAQVAAADDKVHQDNMARNARMRASLISAREDEIMMAQQARVQNIQTAMDSAAAGIQALDDLGAAMIAVAALRAAYAVAVGIMAVAEKGYAGIPQLIAGLAAAAQFAAIAGRSPPSAGSAGAAGASGSSAAPAGQSTSSSASSAPAAGPTVINLFGVSNTKAELGHALAKAKRAAAGTGMA